MAKKNRETLKRVNFYDGQRITEAEMDAEQLYHDKTFSNHVVDFHGSGVIKENPLKETFLFDTRTPNKYNKTDIENPSKTVIEAGEYDGRAIYLDTQPSDSENGNRLEFSLVDSKCFGRNKTKVMILGKIFDGSNSSGVLNMEFIEFEKNEKKITKFYYKEVIAILFNNFSGGLGKNYLVSEIESLNLITETSGYLTIKETEPLSVYPYSEVYSQIESPNNDLINFISSSISNTVEDEINSALGVENTISDLFFDISGDSLFKFEKGGITTKSIGMKFISEHNNIQKIDVLLSVTSDNLLPFDQRYDFNGQLVLSIYELLTEAKVATDFIPDRLIDFDPDSTPIAQISYNQSELEAIGYKLNGTLTPVSFSFGSASIADPNSGILQPGRYYAFLLSRTGDTSVGEINVSVGYDVAEKKKTDGLPLLLEQSYGKRKTKFTEFDPVNKRFIDDSTLSMWYKIHSASIEVTNGSAYTDSGKVVSLEKTKDYIGDLKVSNYKRDIDLKSILSTDTNYVILTDSELFTSPGTHPITGNFVNNRISDVPSISVVTSEELSSIVENQDVVILSSISDKSPRDAEDISGDFSYPGEILTNKIKIINPSVNLLSQNLIGRVINPDISCLCNAKYRIVKATCSNVLSGDLNSDGLITTDDVQPIISLVGNNLSSKITLKKIYSGEIDISSYISADLNSDGAIDGTDIEMLEDAIDGYVNFVAERTFKVLELELEKVIESANPEIFSGLGNLIGSTDEITFTTGSLEESLSLRIGDTIFVSPDTYVIYEYTVADNGLDVTAKVTLNGGVVSFTPFVGVMLTVSSGTNVNLYADNNGLITIPFSGSSWLISLPGSLFSSSNYDVCDLKRYAQSSFIEEKVDSCKCDDSLSCGTTESCSPIYKSQQYLPGDLYIPSGEILSAKGVPYHGDYEFSNVVIPLPAGSITDCSIDLYNTFIKSSDGSCFTAAGYPALKYSDGTYVGCEDNGLDTDLSKGRIKIQNAVCSVFVDSLVEGYAGMSASVAESPNQINEAVIEAGKLTEFTTYDDTPITGDWDITLSDVTVTAASTGPTIDYSLSTSATPAYIYARAENVTTYGSGDFIIDFDVTRTNWVDANLTTGAIVAKSQLTVTNLDGSSAVLSLGWLLVGGSTTKVYYAGTIYDTMAAPIESFNYEIDAPDTVGSAITFRLRRINDIINAYYVIPSNLSGSTISSYGQFIKIGSNPVNSFGDGSIDFYFELAQTTTLNAGQTFEVSLGKSIFKTELTSSVSTSNLLISRTNATTAFSLATLTYPITIPNRTTISAAVITVTPTVTKTVSDTYKVVPVFALDADNLGQYYNYPLYDVQDTFVPGSLVSGTSFDIDVTNCIAALVGEAGHMPGFIKGFVIMPTSTVDSDFTIENASTLNLTYDVETTGIIFKVGTSIDSNGILTLNTRNILYDSVIDENRTTLNIGIHLKKSGFKNSDVKVNVNDLKRMGIGSCQPIETVANECYYIVANSSTGTVVEGPYPC